MQINNICDLTQFPSLLHSHTFRYCFFSVSFLSSPSDGATIRSRFPYTTILCHQGRDAHSISSLLNHTRLVNYCSIFRIYVKGDLGLRVPLGFTVSVNTFKESYQVFLKFNLKNSSYQVFSLQIQRKNILMFWGMYFLMYLGCYFQEKGIDLCIMGWFAKFLNCSNHRILQG